MIEARKEWMDDWTASVLRKGRERERAAV